MAYCLRSFVETLDQVLHPEQHHQNWDLDHLKKPQIHSLFENATFLQDFLDEASPEIQERMSSLEDRIMEAAQKAKDTLESYITDRILSNTEGQSFTISPPDLSEVLHVFEAAKKEVTIEIMDAGQRVGRIAPPISSTRHYPISILVGVEKDLKDLRSRLTSRERFEIIPIVGMGGIGKTTLARLLYDENEYLFDCCAWVTVSQSYDVEEILQTLIACITGKPKREKEKKVKEEKEEEELDEEKKKKLQEEKEKKAREEKLKKITQLKVNLHKALYERRYLIVLDDIWSSNAWDDLQEAFLQDNNEGSRIILTTRDSSLTNYVKSKSHQMSPISEDDSWKLLSKIAFGKESCPPGLEGVGKRIALQCKGLPLALQVIGKLLSQSGRSQWEQVASDVRASIKEDDRFSEIYTWSFDYLPHYLKPCFLYMGVFPEDQAIRASKIIRLWVAEGFLKPIINRSLEEAAEIYLNELVNKNLIYIRGRKKSGKPKSYGMHHLMRHLCLRQAQEKKFLYLKESQTDILQDDKSFLCLVNSHSPIDIPEGFITLKLASHTHSCLLMGHCLGFKPSLLRVLDTYQVKVDEFPEVLLQLVNLRYLAICTKPGEIPRRIYVITNLQTLILKYLVSSSIELVLALPKLRHLKFDFLIRTNDSHHDTSLGVHEHLQSLYNIPLEIIAKSLLGKLPNLRKLGIKCGHYNDDVNLTCFQKLESLKCCHGFYLANGNFISNIIFPHSLKQLTLYSCGVPESLLDAIGLLPKLEVLKLDACIFRWPDWEPVEGEFLGLKYLQISRVRNLKEWRAESVHFPSLEHLVLRNCPNLSEIPDEIGEIETLVMIEVDECKASLLDSARRIVYEQEQYGNTQIQLRLGSVIGNLEKEDDKEEGEQKEDY